MHQSNVNPEQKLAHITGQAAKVLRVEPKCVNPVSLRSDSVVYEARHKDVIAISDDICIKVTGDVREQERLADQYMIDCEHTTKPLFCILDRDFKMIAYGMERFDMTLEDLKYDRDRQSGVSWRSLRMQVKDTVAKYILAKQLHNDIKIDNIGIKFEGESGPVVKFFDPLGFKYGEMWLSNEETELKCTISKMRQR